MAYYNPNMTGLYNPLYTANNQGFGHCSPGKIQTAKSNPQIFPGWLKIFHGWLGINLENTKKTYKKINWFMDR